MPTKQLNQSELNEALLSAAEKGETNKVKELILKGANINAKDNDGNTPLIMAVLFGRTEIAELLLTHGADINAKDNDGDTPLIRAAWYGHTETAELLFIHGADPALKNNEGKTAEDIARNRGNKKIADMLKNAVEQIKLSNGVDEHLAHQQRIHEALRRKDPLTMTNKEFLDSLEAEITNGK